MDTLKIRRYKEGDAAYLWSLLFNTVHHVNAKDYSHKQIEAWAPQQWDIEKWACRLSRTCPFIAEIKGRVVGFAELWDNGYIDCFYSSYDWQRRGVGLSLLDAMEQSIKQRGILTLHAKASITARSFFLHCGFLEKERQFAFIRGVRFTHYLVVKHLQQNNR